MVLPSITTVANAITAQDLFNSDERFVKKLKATWPNTAADQNFVTFQNSLRVVITNNIFPNSIFGKTIYTHVISTTGKKKGTDLLLVQFNKSFESHIDILNQVIMIYFGRILFIVF